jgi:hypothetical protein
MGDPLYGPWAIPKTILKINISFSNLIISGGPPFSIICSFYRQKASMAL